MERKCTFLALFVFLAFFKSPTIILQYICNVYSEIYHSFMPVVAIHSRSYNKHTAKIFAIIFSELLRKDAEIVVSEPLYKLISKNKALVNNCEVFKNFSDLRHVDFMLSAGGDGTLLDSATYVRHHNTPILGINLGRLGFLATTPKENIQTALESVFRKEYTLDARTLIELVSDKDIFEDVNFGLNEFAILKKDTSSMIKVHTFIDGDYLTTYWADGLLISTPTGSTGYSLSVGGPVVMPGCNNFIIAPISPHNLNMRPLIVSDNSTISFKIEGRSNKFLVSLDSRSKAVDDSYQMSVKKCNFGINLIKLRGDNFVNTLKMKLNWGLDYRN